MVDCFMVDCVSILALFGNFRYQYCRQTAPTNGIIYKTIDSWGKKEDIATLGLHLVDSQLS